MSSAVNALIPQLANYNPTGFALENQQRQANLATSAAQQKQAQANTALTQQQTQGEALKNQLTSIALRDNQILQGAYAKHAGANWSDPQTGADFEKELSTSGISPRGLFDYRNESLKWRQGLQGLAENQIKIEEALNLRTTDILQGYKDTPDAQKPQIWAQVTAPSLNRLHQDQQFDPTNPLVGTALDAVIGVTAHHKAILDEQKTAAETVKTQQETAASKTGQAATEATTKKTQLETELMQAQLEHYKTLINNPQSLAEYVGRSVNPQQHPQEFQAALSEAQQQPDLKGINAVVEKHGQNIREQERTVAVETNPQVLAAKKKAQEDQANYTNALQQGDTARAKYFESSTDLHQTLAAARSIEHIVELARSGNPISANQLELIVPEFTAAMQGIKPRGMQLNEKGFTSTYDRVYNEISSASAGKPLSESTLNQIMPYIRTIANGAAQNHNAVVQTIKQAYRQNYPEEPIPYQNTANPGTAAKSPTGTIRVRRKSDGATGTLQSADFDESKYDKL